MAVESEYVPGLIRTPVLLPSGPRRVTHAEAQNDTKDRGSARRILIKVTQGPHRVTRTQPR